MRKLDINSNIYVCVCVCVYVCVWQNIYIFNHKEDEAQI